MAKAILDSRPPAMWEIERTGPRGEDAFVRFGQRRIGLNQIVGMSLEEVRTRHATGLLIASASFLMVASFFSYMVFEQDMMQRWLVVVPLLCLLGFGGLLEVSRLKVLRHFELTLTLLDGELVVFTCTDRADIQALALRLATEQGRQSG